MSRSLLSALSAFALLAAACSGGSPQPGGLTKHDVARAYSEQHGIPYYETDPYQEPYHPCVEIPDEVLSTMGVDPATSVADSAGAPGQGWRRCNWRGPGYGLSVWTTIHPLDDLRSNPRYTAFRDVQIAGRDAIEFRIVDSTIEDQCTLGFATYMGMAWVRIAPGSLTDDFPPGRTSCSVASDHATTLAAFLPGR